MRLLGEFIKETSVRNKSEQKISVYSVTNSDGFKISTEVFSKEVFSKDLKNYKIVESGDFSYNPSRINVGSVDFFNTSDSKGLVSPLYVTFKVDDNLNKKYLKYFLKSSVGRFFIGRLTKGAVRDSLSFRDLCRLPIPFVPLSEQEYVVEVLQKIEHLRQQRKLSLQLIDDFLRASFIEMFGDLVQNTGGWGVGSVGEVCEARLGKMLDSKKQTGKHLRLYLRNANVQWDSFNLDSIHSMDFDEADRREFRLRAGDVLVCEGGEIGRTAIWEDQIPECYFQKAIHRLRFNPHCINPEYFVGLMRFYSENNGFKDYVSSATIAHLTGEKLSSMKIPLPPIELQEKYAVIAKKAKLLRLTMSKGLFEMDNQFNALLQSRFS